MTTNFLNNDNQTSLLFKRFQNVVQTGIDEGFGETQFSAEGARSLKNVFNNTIFRNDVDSSLNPIYYCKAMTLGSPGSPDISSAEWDSNTNNILNQTYFPYQIPGTDLTYYKDIYLKPVQGTLNAWFFPTTTDDTTDVNLLKNMIPFNYNPIYKDAFTPIVKFYNGSSWTQQGQNDTTGLNWLVDYESGVLELYQTASILENSPYQLNLNATDEFGRLRISCICYTGPMGITGGGSGLINVGDISNGIIQNQLDVSGIYFDTDGFDVSLNVTNNTAIITNKSGGGSSGGIADLSYNFFDIPLAPYNGSGTVNTTIGAGQIELDWSNPSRVQSALPFGTFTSYENGSSNQSDLVQIKFLPFHQHLHIEFMEFNGAGVPNGDLSNNNDWIDISINNNVPNQKVIPNTISQFFLNAESTFDPSVSLLNNLGGDTAPYTKALYTGLSLGKGYQFRLYLDNNGINLPVNNGKDILYGQDVSWNYLYIPDNSSVGTNFIKLGSYGPAEKPTDATFNTFNWNTPNDLKILLSTTNDADSSLNTPFPINPLLSLRYKFGIDVSGIINNSIQDPSSIYYNVVVPSNNYPFSIEDLSSNLGVSANVEFPLINDLIFDLSVCPQFKYTLNNLYGLNNATNYETDRAYNLDVSASITIPIPPRNNAITKSQYKESLSNGELAGSSVENIQNITWDFPINAITSLSSQATTKHEYDVYFLENNSSFDISFNTPIPLSSNNVVDNLLGTDSSGFQLSYFDLSYNPPTQNDISGISNITVGYLQKTYIDISNEYFNMDISAVEAGKTPIFQYQGYYTGLDLYKLLIKNIKLDNYQDICNNVINTDEYDPYTLKLIQYYNDNSQNILTPNFITDGSYQYYDLYVGKRPNNDISLSTPTYNSPSATLNNYLMGLRRPNPSSSIPFDISYSLSDIDPNWVEPSSLNSLSGIAKNYLNYTASSSGLQCDIEVEPYPNNNSVTINVTPTLEIPTTLFTTDKKYSRGDTVGSNQFEFTGEYATNVTFGLGPQNISPIGILFGGKTILLGGRKLWWDYTWGGTGTQPTALPSGVFTSNPSSSIVFIKAIGYNGWSNDTSYDHNISITNKQLMWANGGFAGVALSSLVNNPYIDFSNNYYNPNGELLDYSIYNLSGLSGESFSQTYTASPAQNNFWNQTQGPSTTVNRVLKYITFNIDCPYRNDFQNYNGATSQEFLFQINLNLDHEPNVSSTSGGYWLFHNEKNTTGSTFGAFDGQKLWTTATGTSSGSGSWYKNIGGDEGYKIAFPSQTSGAKTILQISIGLPSDLDISITEVNITFIAV